MSKLVVKIRDDDKHFPHCPLHHEGYCHLPQTHYRKDNALYMIECLGTINKRPPWCPLKEEKEAIPIEWIEEYANNLIKLENENYFAYNGFGDWGEGILSMLRDWEEENEQTNC